MTSPTPRRATLRGDRCRCNACGLLFARTSTFDAHRYGRGADRHCRTVAELEAKGWAVDANGFWRRARRGLQSPSHPSIVSATIQPKGS
jgi:hypothetical protein